MFSFRNSFSFFFLSFLGYPVTPFEISFPILFKIGKISRVKFFHSGVTELSLYGQ